MNIHYVEVVTNEVDQTIEMFEAAQGLSFGDPVAELGHARTASSPTGGMIGVRPPMHDAEETVVRPYFLTESLSATLDAVTANGAEVALPPMEIPGHGTIAIYFVDGLQYGLWQL